MREQPAHYDYVDWQDLGPAGVEVGSAIVLAAQKLSHALRPARATT
ncbi:MAG TPA: hypothetical protein VLR26_03400 [Frankiaceae bacterium]|nr:hypothetical protein [Frankiaceae bacterium]